MKEYYFLLFSFCALADVNLCRIVRYDFTDYTNEFANVSHFIGRRGSGGETSVAVRIVSVEIEEPKNEFIVARSVFEHMRPVEIIDALYNEYPRRKYLACGNETYNDSVAEFVFAPRERLIAFPIGAEHQFVLAILVAIFCCILLFICLCVERQ